MTDKPDGVALLREARRTLLKELLPNLAEGDKLTGLMIANAIAIGARELEATGTDETRTNDARRLAADVRAGRHDADRVLHQSLLENCANRLRTSNPKALR